MSRISEKVAYLDGLMDGMEIKDEKYAKLFNAIIDALDVIAEEISDHEDILEDHDDSIDEIFDTLDEHEEILFDDDLDDEDDDGDKEDRVQKELPCSERPSEPLRDDRVLESEGVGSPINLK